MEYCKSRTLGVRTMADVINVARVIGVDPAEFIARLASERES